MFSHNGKAEVVRYSKTSAKVDVITFTGITPKPVRQPGQPAA